MKKEKVKEKKCNIKKIFMSKIKKNEKKYKRSSKIGEIFLKKSGNMSKWFFKWQHAKSRGGKKRKLLKSG